MSKYNAKKTTYQGETFDSKKEARRYAELCLLQRAGKISNLKRQVPFQLVPPQYENGKCVERSVKYIADFVYTENGETVVEDAKGYRTNVYTIKRKLMLWLKGVRIKEV